MQRSSIFTSAAFHAIIIIIAIVGLPFLTHRDLVIPQPITVDLVDISKVTETNNVTPQPAPPKPEPPKPPKPQPAPQNTAPAPVVPVKEPPKPEEKVVKPDKPAETVDENAPPKKEKPVKKPENKKPPPQRDFSSVLKNLDVSKQTPPPTPPPGQNTPLGEKMTMSEEDALRSQLEGCWNPPIGAKDIENMTVQIVMVINPDRTLREAHIADTSRYNSDSFFQAVADSALRAVESPNCSPFDLPPDKYNTWSNTTVNFSPKDMF